MATKEALVNFRKSYPIDFSLLDQDDQAVMYISEDKDDWELNLTIANTSSQSITLIDQPGNASNTNHHFAIRFRPGTLAKRAIDLLTGSESNNVVKTTGWEIAKLAPPAANAAVTLYLRCTVANTVLKQSDKLSIKLSGLSAAPGSGSRGTQVELIPHQLKFDGEAGTAITNSRTQYLHVTNHSGRKNIPLHVGFVGGNRVLNDKDIKGNLKLRITNVFKSKDARQSTILFRGPNSPTGEPQSELVLSYDKGSTDWELVSDKIKSVNAVSQKKSLNLTGTNVVLGDRPEWLMAFDKDYKLEYGESFDIEISEIDVSPVAGQANLYLHYNHVPGYWDGQFVCAVEKGPIIVNGNNVGIGTTDPIGRLNIVASDKGRGVQIENGEIKIRHDLNSHFSIINGRVANHLTIDNSSNNEKMNSGFGPAEGPVRKALLSISNDGRVGVGLDDATSKLDVDGETKTTTLKVSESATLNTLKVDNVSTLHTLKLTSAASAPMDISGGGTIQLGGGSLELGWTADKTTQKPDSAWVQTHGVPLVINPLGNSVVIGPASHKGKVEILGDLSVTGQVVPGVGVWKEVIAYGGGGVNFSPYTTVESMKDEKGVVHLRGILFVRKVPVKDDYVCRLDPSHQPKSNHEQLNARLVTSSNDPNVAVLWVVGAAGNPSDQAGWIKVTEFKFPNAKLIALDGLKFNSTV